MKIYEEPQMEIVVFTSEDIITTSGDLTPPIPGEDEGGIF